MISCHMIIIINIKKNVKKIINNFSGHIKVKMSEEIYAKYCIKKLKAKAVFKMPQSRLRLFVSLIEFVVLIRTKFSHWYFYAIHELITSS